MSDYEKKRGAAIEKSMSGNKEEVEEGKGKPCPKCKKVICEPHCVEESLEETKGLDIEKCRSKEGEKGYAWAGVVWKDSECLLKRANAGIDEEWNKWKLEGGGHVDGHSLTIVQCKDKDCEGRRNVTIHYEAGGAGVKSENNESGTLSEGWVNKKDKILFESLVNKWIK